MCVSVQLANRKINKANKNNMSRECSVRSGIVTFPLSHTHMYFSLFSIEIEYDTEVVTENEANKK